MRPPPGRLASLPFHLSIFGLPDPVRPSAGLLGSFLPGSPIHTHSCQGRETFRVSHWLLGPAWGRRLGARPGGTFYISCPCQALRQPEQPPTSPWPPPQLSRTRAFAGRLHTAQGPASSLLLSKTDPVPRTAVGRKKAGFGFCDREASGGERPLPCPPPSPRHPVIQWGDRQDPAAWPPPFPPDCPPAASWGEPLGQMVVSSSSVRGA